MACGAATLLSTAAATLLSTAVVQPDRQTGTAFVALSLKSATIRVKSAVRRRVDAVFVIICCASVVVSVVVLRLVLCSFGRAALWHNIVLRSMYVRQTTITITHYSTAIVRSNYYVYSRQVELRTY